MLGDYFFFFILWLFFFSSHRIDKLASAEVAVGNGRMPFQSRNLPFPPRDKLCSMSQRLRLPHPRTTGEQKICLTYHEDLSHIL